MTPRDSTPPRWLDRLIECFCAPHLREEVLGDLHERYYRRVQQVGEAKAQRRYWREVLAYLRPSVIRRPSYQHPTPIPMDMLRNHFTIAFRNLSKHKSFAIINIAGLTLGIASALVIFLLVRFELSFDTFHSKADRIYRVLSGGPGEVEDTGTPHGLMEILKEEFPEVAQVAVAYKLNAASTQIEINNQLTREPNICFVTPSFFDIFDVSWKVGSPEKSLSQPGQVVIDEDLAQKYFQGDAMGKSIRLNNEFDLVVSGILQNAPANTDIPIQIAVSHATFQREDNYQSEYNSSSNSFYHTYILLQEGADPKATEAKFHGMIEKYISKEVADKYWAHALQPLSDIHFNVAVGENNISEHAISKESIASLSLIGLFLLVTACINFVNLSTAQAMRRSKEVGIRKVLGSTRRQMIGQLMSETLLLTLVAVVLSYLFATAAFPYLPGWLGVSLDTSLLYQPSMVLLALGIVVLVSGLAGFYPALVLSRFQPAATVKNSFTNRQTGGLILRKGLIVFQFGLSQVLIICTVVVISQMHYFNTTSLGFDKEAIVTVDLPKSDPQKLQTLKTNLMQYAAIEAISFSINTPAAVTNNWWTSYSYGTTPNEKGVTEQKFIDDDFLSLYSIPLLAGRNVREGDSTQLLVNESFLRENAIQNPQDALGATINFWGMKAPIVGVVKNFHSQSLHEEIPPVIMARFPTMFQKASFKVNRSQAQDAIAHIEQQWKVIFPGYYFTFQFLDDDLATMYEHEQSTSRLLSFFAGLAIFIGCLGLYGLISFVTAQKTKEVGIRKVLGATVQHIVYLFTKDFVVLVAIAFVIAAPIGYYFMEQWLADFTYKINIQWWMFAVAALAGVVIALLTISFQSIKAALANPVDSLRNE